MRSENHDLIKISLLSLILFSCFTVFAQQDADLSKFQARYPGAPIISELENNEVKIDLDKSGIPVVKVSQYSSLLVLKENTTSFADSKEYFHCMSRLDKLKAYSKVPSGKSFKEIEVDNYKKQTEISDGLYFNDSYSYSFVFPSVNIGTRLVTEIEKTNLDPHYPVIFYFGGYIPADSARICVSFPKNVKITYHLFGYDTNKVVLKKTSKGNREIYEWYASNLPAYAHDDYSPSGFYTHPHIIIHISEYNNSGVEHKVISDMDALYQWYYSRIDSLNLQPSQAINDLTDSLTRNITTEREKVKVIANWVQKNIKYIAIEDGNNGLIPREASLVLQRRYGDCKDKSSLLKAMFTAAGLKASLAWLGSRDLPYKYSVFPSPRNSDHMIAVWWEDEKPVYIDGTADNQDIYYPPAFIQGKECLIESGKDKYHLFTIPVIPAIRNHTIDSIRISVNGKDIEGYVKSSITGEEKTDYFTAFEYNGVSKHKEIVSRRFFFPSKKYVIDSIVTSDLKKTDEPLIITFHLQLPDYAINNNSSTYVNLNLERYYQDGLLKDNRTIPYESEECYVHTCVYILPLPSGSKPPVLPDDQVFSSDVCSFSAKYSYDNNQIVLVSEIKMDRLLIEGPELNSFNELIKNLKKAYSKSIAIN
jgi:hypothetical protein